MKTVMSMLICILFYILIFMTCCVLDIPEYSLPPIMFFSGMVSYAIVDNG